MATAATRSTLVNHCVPPFYACYLLKSVKTPRATATYIGSTPSPPRRIRQHNGEITQGAWKTERNRPWIMQMIVHGFPSKLAALQFEWAWQHPHISRHLRNEDGKAKFARSNLLKHRIQVAFGMICSHPYNTWALHVKLFTEEATKIWNMLSTKRTLPLGFTFSVELEGVDGKSGKVGSGRTGPIDVTDAQFTTSHLYKAHSLSGPYQCSVCEDPIHDFPANALEVALCPNTGCTAVSHLTCLAKSFTASDASSTITSLVPRGGDCPSCHSYVLWGDIIRGCYRIHKGGTVELLEDAEDQMAEDDTNTEADSDDMDAGLEENTAPKITKRKGKEKAVTEPRPRGRPRKEGGKEPTSTSSQRRKARAQPPAPEEEGEYFDLKNISTSDSEKSVDVQPVVVPKKRGRPPKASTAPGNNAGPSVSSPLASPVKKRGRPRKSPVEAEDIAPHGVALATSPAARRDRSRKRPAEIEFFELKSDHELEDTLSGLSISSPNLSEMEEQVFGNAVRRRQAEPESPTKRGRGRPRKAEYIEISD